MGGVIMDKLTEGWLYFLKNGILKTVELPKFGELNIKISDGVVTLVEVKNKIKI